MLNALLNPAAVGQQVQAGFQAGRQARQENDTRNALSALVTNPGDQQAMQTLAHSNPQAALQMQDRNRQSQAQQAKAQQEQQTADLTQRALGGDEAALNELATVNFQRYSALADDQKAAAREEAKAFAGAALDVLQLPFNERQGRIVGYAQQMPQYADEINQLAFLPPEEQEAALRAAIVEGNLIEKLHAMERPRYQAIPEGGTLVDTSNPSAVRDFQGQQGGAPPLSAIEAELARRGVR